MNQQDDLAPRASAQSDEIHRTLASSVAGTCGHLIYDPALHALEDDERTAGWAAHGRVALPLAIPDARVDQRLHPLLLPLNSAMAADSAIVHEAILLSLEELQPAALAHGQGRRIGGFVRWKATEAKQAHLGHALGKAMLHRRPNGVQTWLRLSDPAVLWAIWPMLTSDQQADLMGPIEAWWLHDPVGNLQVLRAAATSNQPLRFSAEQWPMLDDIESVNLAFRAKLGKVPEAMSASSEQVAHWYGDALKALRRATLLGMADREARSTFCALALTLHPRFDEHALVKDRLHRDANENFMTLVDGLSADDRALIAADLDRLKSN